MVVGTDNRNVKSPAEAPGISRRPSSHAVPVAPRVALAACAVGSVAVSDDLRVSAALLVSILVFALAIGRLPALFTGWKTVAPVVLSLLVVYAWAYPGTSSGLLDFGVEGFVAGLAIALKLLGFVGVLQLLVTATGERALVRWAGDLNEDLGVILSLSLSIIPVMRRTMATTLEAQQARGMQTQGSLLGRLRSFLAVIVPVVVKSFVRAYGLATLLYVRGHGTGRRARGRQPLTAASLLTWALGPVFLSISIASRFVS